MLELIAAASATALATGLGTIPVFMLGPGRARALRPALLGFAAGSMGVAAIAGLILPALDSGSAGSVAAGLAVGVAFMVLTGMRLRPAADASALARSRHLSTLMFVILLVHSLPEGLAIGTAYASDDEGLALFVIVAIAAQNIPEGTSVAIPMAAGGATASHQFWAAVMTSAPQPVGAVIAYLAVEQVADLLPFSFGFAAGAMLALIVIELLPSSVPESPRAALAGIAVGAGLMLGLSAALGV